MRHLRSLAVVLAAAALALSVGTGAFSATTAERGVQVSVVDDDEAYVGYETTDLDVEDGDTEEILNVTNRLTEPIDVTDVSVSDTGSLTVTVGAHPADIGPGTSADVRATFECDEAVEETITVSVTVESSSESARVAIDGDTTERQFTVSCEPPSVTVTGVTFKGNGNAMLKTGGGNGAVAADVWIKKDGKLQKVVFDGEYLKTSKPVRPQVNGKIRSGNGGGSGPGSYPIVAIGLHDSEISYVDRNWNKGALETPLNTNQGTKVNQLVDAGFLNRFNASSA